MTSTGVECNGHHAGGGERAPLTIGIDIGTQVCSAALLQDGDVVDVELQDGEGGASALFLPSYVSVTDVDFEVGEEARKRALAGDPNTVFDFVRLVGRKLRDFGPSDFARWPFKVASVDSGAAVVEVLLPTPVAPRTPTSGNSNSSGGTIHTFRPEELMAVLVRCMKEKAELQAHGYVESAVVCLPGDFNHTQRQAVRAACEIAGLRVDKLLNGPTAAVISYALEAMPNSSRGAEDGSTNTVVATRTPKLILAVDIGARSTDIALVSTLANRFDVKAVDCDPHLGGDAFTDRIAAHCLRKRVEEPKKNVVADHSEPPQLRGRTGYSRSADQIRHACELAKKLLTLSVSAVVGIDFPEPDTFGYYTVTRPSFDALCEDLWQQLLERVCNAVQESYVRLKEIDAVLLLGESAQIPRLQLLFRECFPERCVVVPRASCSVSPAHGCAALSRGSIELTEVTPLALGIQSIGGTRILMIPRNTKTPVRDALLYYANSPNVAMVHIVEGRDFCRARDTDVHLLATVRVDDSLAATHPVLKIDIAFEVTSLDELVVTAAEHSTGREVTRLICSDDTSLSVSAIARARARLYSRIDDATEMVYVPVNSVLQIPHLTGESLMPTEHPVVFLRAYVRALESAIASDATDLTLSRKDKALVRAIGAELRADSSDDDPAELELLEFV